MSKDEKWVIRGVTEEGKKLRPSDWIERISSTLASFGSDHRLHYSNAVAPCMIDGEKCLVVARNLNDINPEGKQNREVAAQIIYDTVSKVDPERLF